MAWLLLVLAGLFEVGWAIGLKYTDGFTRPWPTVGTVAAMVISLGLLGRGRCGGLRAHAAAPFCAAWPPR